MQTLSPLSFLLLFLSYKLSYSNSRISIPTCPKIEKRALLDFKQSLQDPLHMLSSWNSTTVDCCYWTGIICSNSTGRVLEIHLQNYQWPLQGLRGEITLSLLDLKHLTYFDLSQNRFGSPFPSFIGSLTSLEYLNLSGTGFLGKIPVSFGNLSNLCSLSLDESSVSSQLEVSSLEWLTGLSKLEYLNMNHVNLSRAAGSAIRVIDKLPSLVELHLSFCGLDDSSIVSTDDAANISRSCLAFIDLSSNYRFQSLASVPKWIFQLGNLVFLDLSFNSFQGPIPEVSNCTKLRYIDLSRNNFNSTIPDWLYSCKDLELIDLRKNYLYGSISSSIANLTSLSTLDLGANELSGKIPRDITSLCKMRNLFLDINRFQGELSYSFGNMPACFLATLESLYLNGNQLSGRITSEFGEFKNLLSLNFRGNSLSGVIPDNIGNISSLKNLNLGFNKLIGHLPESVGRLSNLTTLSMDGNMLEGVVTEAHFARLSNLKNLFASGNQKMTLKVDSNWVPPFELEILVLRSWTLDPLDTRVPSWLETQKNSIRVLDLSCTGISGQVPNWAWNVTCLNLSCNQLQGKIPYTIGISSSFQYVYLSSNKFSGPLPRIASTVYELDLSKNSFSGSLSTLLPDSTVYDEAYSQLQILNLAGNRLTGELPDFGIKLPFLKVLNLGKNELSGTIRNSIGLLKQLQSLNLGGNKFSGRIPLTIQNCTKLVKMDLSSNGLYGDLPAWNGTNLPALSFLILHSNELTGEIGQFTCRLSSLQILDLSNNRFSGRIPACIGNFSAMASERSLPSNLYSETQFATTDYLTRFVESASVTTKGSELEYDTILPLVTSIDFSENDFSGSIPNEITRLVELRSLNLSGNHLMGLIPDGIGKMKQMESLDLSRNALSGEIPSGFSDMSSLSYVNLSFNDLTGKIPEGTQIGGFSESSFVGNRLCGPPLTVSCEGGGWATGRGVGEGDDGDESRIEWLYMPVSSGYGVGLLAFFLVFFLKKSWRRGCDEFLEDYVLESVWCMCLHGKYWRRLGREFS